jgi:hypothetical protein
MIVHITDAVTPSGNCLVVSYTRLVLMSFFNLPLCQLVKDLWHIIMHSLMDDQTIKLSVTLFRTHNDESINQNRDIQIEK